MGELTEEVDGRQAQQLGGAMREQPERAQRIGARSRRRPCGARAAAIRAARTSRSAALIRQAAADTQNGRRGSRPPSRPPIAGPMTKPRPKATPIEAEGLGAAVRRGDVGDVGEGGADGGRGDARDDPADEQQGERGRHRHEDVVEPEPEAGDQDHRPPAVAVRQRAEQRREEELHQRPDGREGAEHLGSARRCRRP